MSDIVRIEASRPWDGEIIIHRGETFDPEVEFSTDSGVIDWSNHTGELLLYLGDSTRTLSTDDGSLLMRSDGVISPRMSDTETAAISACNGNFKLFTVDQDGNRRLFGRGPIEVD